MTAAVDPLTRLRAWAGPLLSAGWHLEPCRIVLVPNNRGELKKMPDGLRSGWQMRACTTIEEFDQRCAQINATGYLISCGPSGIVAADADGELGIQQLEALGLPATMTVDTPHGQHRIFAADDRRPVRNSQSAGPGLDIRGIGGGLFGPGSVVLTMDGQVAGSWRGRSPVLNPAPMPESIALVGHATASAENHATVTNMPPPARRDPAGEEAVTQAFMMADKNFQIMASECQNPTGRWNQHLYEFVRWLGRAVAGMGYEDVDDAIDYVRNAASVAIHGHPLMTDPDAKDLVTLNGQAAAVGLRRGPWERSESADGSGLEQWGAPENPSQPGSLAAGLPGSPVPVTTDAVAAMRSKFLTADQLRAIPKPDPLIDGFIDSGSFALLYGAPGSMKSFVVLDMLACIANGKPWQGHATRQVDTLYVAAEGGKGIGKRLTAWERSNQLDSRVRTYPEPIDLYGGAEIDVMLQAVLESGIGVVCFDTLNRCTPGMDENTSKDVGIAIARIGRLTRSGITVIVVHHTPRDGNNPRGSTALEGATDHGIRVDRPARHGPDVTVTNERQKDEADGAFVHLQARLDLDADSLCLVSTEQAEQTSPEQDVERAVLAFLAKAAEPMSERDLVRAKIGVGRHTERKAAVATLVERGFLAAVDSVPSVRGGKAVAVGASRFQLTETGHRQLIAVDTVPAPEPPSMELVNATRLTPVDTVDKQGQFPP